MRPNDLRQAFAEFLSFLATIYAGMTLGMILTRSPAQIAAESYWGGPAIVATLFLLLFSITIALAPRTAAVTRIILIFGQAMSVCCLILFFAIVYADQGVSSAEKLTDGLDYVYFSIVTFTTLGYGDFTPDVGARIIAAFQASIGFLLVPIVISEAFAVLTRK